MRCPECRGKGKTLETRRIKGTRHTRRRIECMMCGHRFSTLEVIVEDAGGCLNTYERFKDTLRDEIVDEMSKKERDKITMGIMKKFSDIFIQ